MGFAMDTPPWPLPYHGFFHSSQTLWVPWVLPWNLPWPLPYYGFSHTLGTMGYAMEPPIVFPQHRLPKGQKTVFRGGRGPQESFRSDFFL